MKEYTLWVCPDPKCSYYETECGSQLNRHCPVTKVGDREVHPILASPRLKPFVLKVKNDVDSR